MLKIIENKNIFFEVYMSKVSEVSFGRICIGKPLKSNPQLKKQAESLARYLRRRNLHKTKYVDVFLHHDDYRGFYGVISSKKQGTPMNPHYRTPIVKEKLENFVSWLQEWEYNYNPKTIRMMKKIEKEAVKELIKKYPKGM